MTLACGLACTDRDNPQVAFDHAYQTFVHGDLIRAQSEAEQDSKRYSHSHPDWALRFRVLEAEALLWRGMYPQALAALDSLPSPSISPDAAVQILTLKGIAHGRRLEFEQAEKEFADAERLCTQQFQPGCGKLFQGRGLIALGRNQFTQAQQFLKQSLSVSRTNGDRFLEATSLLNLGATSLKEDHFDESIDWSESCLKLSTALGADDISLVAILNLGWAYYKLGDSEKALELSLEAEHRAHRSGDSFNQENGLTNAGYVYMERREFSRAGEFFGRALQLAQTEQSKEHAFNALRVLARLALQTNDLEKASQYAEQALQISRESGNHADELYPILVQGQIAARRGEAAEAEKTFQQVERDKACPVFLKWEAEHSLARLYEDRTQPAAADREYRAALATFEAARHTVQHEDSQLSFLTNAAHIYDDYVHFLVAHGRTDDALRWADYSRAQTLAEGLGLLPSTTANGTAGAPPALHAQEVSRRVKGTLLFYWLGERQSYLWAIAPHRTQLFPLPPGQEIEAAVQRYRQALAGPQDVLAPADDDGLALYHMLVAPALALLPENVRVFVIPDGGLNNLNFETLIVPGPKPRFWIEDATIADASSLRLLSAAYASHKERARRLLLVGDSVSPSKEYPELPQATVQMESVARHFSSTERRILARDQATPDAYLNSHPEQFSYIHFVAHGTASRLSPLDSAIVLSRERTSGDSFKLYARDIIRHPLRADLVTISACYGAGDRAYSGEGLVGLSWAFLRAGAHNVIAALWEATDVSTEQLMGKFYDELDKGENPDAALRSAKLALLHGRNFHNPFYWAPFQLYTGA